MIKVGFISLGCSKNGVDTEVMLHKLVSAGYEVVTEETEADVVIVNTCGFIESAKQESIDQLLDVAWLKENGNLKALIATGCLAERYREQILEEMPEVDGILGVGSLDRIADAVEAVLSGKRYTSFENKETSPLGGDRVLTTPEYTAYLKIAEGCDNRCTYCAIPLIRGKMRSRTIEDIVDEAKMLADNGVTELTLVAQDTTRYGMERYGKPMLPALLKDIARVDGIRWIRVLYCYPELVTQELLETVAGEERICSYLMKEITEIARGLPKHTVVPYRNIPKKEYPFNIPVEANANEKTCC